MGGVNPRLGAAVGLMFGAIALAGAPANAASFNVYNLDVNNLSIAGSLGTVTVTDLGTGSLEYAISLNSPYLLQGGPATFAFSLNTSLDVTLSNFSQTGYSGSGSPDPNVEAPNLSTSNQKVKMDGLGSWMFQVDNNNGNGGSGAVDSSLTFDATAPGGLTLASILQGAPAPGDTPKPAYWLAVDFCVSDGDGGCSKTGYAASYSYTHHDEAPPPAVPLPSAIWLMGTALAGAAGASRLRKRKMSKPA